MPDIFKAQVFLLCSQACELKFPGEHSYFCKYVCIWQADGVFAFAFLLYPLLWTKHLCLSQSHSVEAPIPSMMVFASQTLGMPLGHEGAALMNGISALTRSNRRGIISLCYVRIQQEDGCLQTRKRIFSKNHIGQHLDVGLPSL